MEVSRKIRENRPNHIAMFRPRKSRVEKCREPAFGRNSITRTATTAPTIRYGLRRPILHQVRSEYLPMRGCTIMPISGGRIQNQESWWGSAPRVAKMRLMFALCSAYAIWTPRKPKLRSTI